MDGKYSYKCASYRLRNENLFVRLCQLILINWNRNRIWDSRWYLYRTSPLPSNFLMFLGEIQIGCDPTVWVVFLSTELMGPAGVKSIKTVMNE